MGTKVILKCPSMGELRDNHFNGTRVLHLGGVVTCVCSAAPPLPHRSSDWPADLGQGDVCRRPPGRGGGACPALLCCACLSPDPLCCLQPPVQLVPLVHDRQSCRLRPLTGPSLPPSVPSVRDLTCVFRFLTSLIFFFSFPPPAPRH